jgi:hypothetical protein
VVVLVIQEAHLEVLDKMVDQAVQVVDQVFLLLDTQITLLMVLQLAELLLQVKEMQVEQQMCLFLVMTLNVLEQAEAEQVQ